MESLRLFQSSSIHRVSCVLSCGLNIMNCWPLVEKDSYVRHQTWSWTSQSYHLSVNGGIEMEMQLHITCIREITWSRDQIGCSRFCLQPAVWNEMRWDFHNPGVGRLRTYTECQRQLPALLLVKLLWIWVVIVEEHPLLWNPNNGFQRYGTVGS